MTNLTAVWPIWFMIREATREHPISIAEIHAATGMSVRSIKAAVERLRLEGEPVGASRGRHPGYFLVTTSEDAEAAAVPMVRQALAMLRTAKAMLPAARYRELLGQLPLEGAH